MKHRMLSLFLMVVLLAATAQYTRAETETGEKTPPSVSLKVEYDEPTADGRLSAWLYVSCDQGNSSESVAENVIVQIQAHERIEYLDVTGPYEIGPQPNNCYVLYLHDMASGTKQMCTLRLQYKFQEPVTEKTILGTKTKPVHQYLNEDGTYIEPWLNVTVSSDNYGMCEYTCDLDIMSKPRALLIGWDLDEEGVGNIQNDLNMMGEAYSGCYFNGLPVEVEAQQYNQEITSVDAFISGIDIDDNDITFIYVNAHGYMDYKQYFAGMNSGYQLNINGEIIDAPRVIAYKDLVDYFSTFSGRVVIVLDICFSGNAMDAAPEYLDPDRTVLITSVDKETFSGAYPSYGWFANDVAKMGGAAGHIDWEEALTEAIAKADALNTVKLSGVEAIKALGKLITDPNEDGVITAGEVYSRESARGIQLAADKAVLTVLLAMPASFFLDEEKANELISTGICPQIYGNADLPVFVRDEEYDDGKVFIAVKNEKYRNVYRTLCAEFNDFDYAEYLAYLDSWSDIYRRDDRILGTLQYVNQSGGERDVDIGIFLAYEDLSIPSNLFRTLLEESYYTGGVDVEDWGRYLEYSSDGEVELVDSEIYCWKYAGRGYDPGYPDECVEDDEYYKFVVTMPDGVTHSFIIRGEAQYAGGDCVYVKELDKAE